MKPVKPSVTFPETEEGILKLWKKNNTFLESLERRKNDTPYMFYDGPPFATGTPHYGHLLAGTIKDIIPRYWSMKGRYIERRFGWDTHGLPIEMLTEKELGISGRHQILEHGVGNFNEACRAGVLKYVDEWEKTTNRLGRWIDFVNDYKTMDLTFMDSVWWVLKSLWDKGRIYEGARVVPYSWRLSTPLSNFEAGSNYKDVQDPAVTLRFQLTDDPSTSILAWTTTPWTLPSNLGLCAGKDIEYVTVKDPADETKKLILAKARLESYFPKDSPEIIEEFLGDKLLGKSYQPLFSYFAEQISEEKAKKAYTVFNDDYVSTEDGTGIVHQSPAHGEDDYRIGQKNGLPLIDPVDAEGNFDERVPDFQGMNIKEADKHIIKALKDKGLLYKQETIQHSYPFCERSDTPLIYKAISAWYVKVEDIQEKMVQNNSSIHWIPEHIKDGRFGKWLANARDWNISRNRFWGNPIPIWRCEECGELECLGSYKELEEKSGETVTDLHSHKIDHLTWSCSAAEGECQGKMVRTPEVLDCWFESGSMPYAQLHYPHENKEKFEQSFPADFIAEGLDQTRGWFYAVMVLSPSLFEKAPFKNVIVNGMILAEDGKKMSKSLKNYPDPNKVINGYGADALRLYMISSAVVRGESLRFSEVGVKDIVRSVLIPYWNVYSFFTTYADIDNYKPSASLTDSSNILDSWIISRFQTLTSSIEKEMEEYRLYAVIPSLLTFLEELTNWYLRRSRRRFWSDDKNDKQDGYNTLFYLLTQFSKALAPFLPFVTEEIYQNLSTLTADSNDTEHDSVHFCDYPTVDKALQNLALEEEMATIKLVVELGRSLRSTLDIKIRQPLQSITVITKNEAVKNSLALHDLHIKEELNVKEVLFSQDEDSYVSLVVKPNFPVLGPIFGKEMKSCAAALKNLSPEQINSLESGGEITVLGKILNQEHVQVSRSPIGDNAIETKSGITVLFDQDISPALAAEGVSRELINRIQRMRKEADFQVTDRIRTEVKSSTELISMFESNKTFIMDETLSLEFNETDSPSGTLVEEHEINDQAVSVGVSVVS